MADTPSEEQLGAAQEAFDTSATGLSTAKETMEAAETAWKADESNEDLKTAFSDSEVAFKGLETTHSGFETTLNDLKAMSKEYWPSDWRDNLAGGDEKLLKRLERYASPNAVSEGLVQAQNKIASGNMALKLNKDSTPEDVKEFRTQNGIPEEAKDYSLDMSEGLVVGDQDKEMLKGFLDSAHTANMSQDQVTGALEWYYSEQDRVQQEQYQNDVAFKSESEDVLRSEFGPEYTPNRNLMANYLSTDFGEGVGALIAGARLADGSLLANHPDIIRGFVAKARISNPMGSLVPGSGEKQLESIIDEISALEKKMGEPGWYADTKSQKRYQQLVEARDSQKA